MADKQLIFVVEGTSAMGPYWKSIVSDYLVNIVRSFCASDMKSSGQAASGSTFELALVMFNTNGPYSAFPVRRSGWTRDVDTFLGWLSTISFSGGGWSDVATTEGLSEALMMFAIPQNGYKTQQNLDGKRHCVLVSASNPYPLPTPVYRPAIEIPEKTEDGEAQTENVLYDAETVSKWFGQCSVSLSVICPKQLPKLKALYNAAKRDQRTIEPIVDVKQPHFLVLISEGFVEACAALSKSGVPPTQNPVSALNPGSAPPISLPSANGSTLNRPTISTGNDARATVKVEPSTVASISSGPTHPHIHPMPRAAAPSVSNLQASSPPSVSPEITSKIENVPEIKPTVTMSQNTLPVGALLNNISNIRGAALSGLNSLALPSMGGNPIGMHQQMSNMISSGMTSSGPRPGPAPAVLSSGPAVFGSATSQPPVQNTAVNSFPTSTSNLTTTTTTNPQGSINNSMVTSVSGGNNTPLMAQSIGSNAGPSGNGSMLTVQGMAQQAQQGMQSIGMNNGASSMQMSQQGPNALPSSQSKYVKVWEGNLSGQRQGQPVFITKLEGYRNATASETLAANWPQTMQIVRLISQDHMNNKQYVGKADFLVFRAMNQHGFLSQLQEKKLCAVIQLPSQTLLLSVSDKACRLIGMLFPGDMVVFKPQIPNPQQQQQQQPQLQQQQQQQLQHMQQLQQQPNVQLQHQQQQMPQLQQQLQQQQQQQQQQIPQLQQLQQQQIPQLNQQQLQQLQQQQHQQQLQQQMQQPPPQPQQMVQQGYMQGPGRPQLAPQGQIPSQGTPPNLPGGGFMG